MYLHNSRAGWLDAGKFLSLTLRLIELGLIGLFATFLTQCASYQSKMSSGGHVCRLMGLCRTQKPMIRKARTDIIFGIRMMLVMAKWMISKPVLEH